MNADMKKKTLFISDLDGSLLDSKGRLSSYSLRVVNDVIANGYLFTFATARSFVSASSVTEGVKLTLPLVVYNGAFLVDGVTKDILFSNYFSLEEVMFIKGVLSEHNMSPIVYSHIDGIERYSFVSESTNVGKIDFLAGRTDYRRREVADINSVYDGTPFYLTCIGNYDELKKLEDVFSADERFTCLLYKESYTGAYFCELIPKRVSKANGIKKLVEILGVERVVSFGDALNDISMFEISDECYALANAEQQLKQIATAVLDSNDNDGVAKWLEANLLHKHT